MSEETLGFSSSTDDAIVHTDADLMMSHASVVDKVIEREELDRQIEAFLASGGKISSIDANVMADPPKKPENRYGSHPI